MKKLFLCLLSVTIISLAYNQTDVDNANYLAEKNIITPQSTESGYRLDDTITRAEVVGIALKIKGITFPENYQCKKYFSDTIKNDWICRSVEIGADIELISRTNKKFRPQDKITRAEAFAIIYKSSGLSGLAENYHFSTDEGEQWQKDLFYKIYNLGFTLSGTTKEELGVGIKYFWSPNKVATRSDIFAFSSQILGKESSRTSENTNTDISIIDGDTIHFNGLKIRMIGLDAPESNNSRYGYAECFGQEAKEHLQGLLQNTNNITLEKDLSQGELDMYGRTLAYILVNGVNINTQMIQDGFGFEETYNSKIYKYQNEHKTAELNAKNNGLGLWSTTTCSGNRKKGTPAEQNNSTNTTTPGAYTCGTKTYCSEMITCEEAKYFLNQCGLSRLDSDSDGIPCEAICSQ